MKGHRFADVFPLLADAELQALAEDIKANGLREAVVTFQGAILDGRNRFAACKRAGLDPRLVEFRGTEEEALHAVMSWNLHRRHLSESQRAMVGAEIEPMFEELARKRQLASRAKPGEKAAQPGRGQICPDPHRSRDDAAAAVNVSARSVESAKKVKEKATPAVVDAVRKGDMSVSLAAQLSDAEPAVQELAVEKIRTNGVRPAEAVRQARAEAGADGDCPEDPRRRRLKRPGPPSEGIRIAESAIGRLNEIREDDLERADAFSLVRRWLDAHEA